MGSLVLATLGNITTSTQAPAANTPGQTGPWYPPQWTGPSQFGVPALTLTATDPTTGNQTAYVFDGTINAEHDQTQVITLNPVQTGAAITDNAYVVPGRLTVELVMSDAMASFTVGQWSGAPSRSVDAYQTLLTLQGGLVPVQVATRLRQYSNMMLTGVRANETFQTKYALRATITFTQILFADVSVLSPSTSFSSSTGASQIPQSTGQTQTGQIQGVQPVPQYLDQNNNIMSLPPDDLSQVPSVDGSGNWSSYNVSGLTNLPYAQ